MISDVIPTNAPATRASTRGRRVDRRGGPVTESSAPNHIHRPTKAAGQKLERAITTDVDCRTGAQRSARRRGSAYRGHHDARRHRLHSRWSRPAHRVTLTLVVLQLWAVAGYVVMGPVPYLWPAAAYPSLAEGGVPMWVLGVPAVLLGMPGFWVVFFGVAVGAILSAAGAAVLGRLRPCGPEPDGRLAGRRTLLNVALLVVSLTPVGTDIRIWVLD